MSEQLKKQSEKDWKGMGVEEFDTLRRYIETYDKFPNNSIYYSSDAYGYIIYDLLYNKLIEKGAKILFISKSYNDKTEIIRKVYFEYNRTFILLDAITSKESSAFPEQKFESKYTKIASMLVVLHENESIDKEVHDLILSCKIESLVVPSVSIISRDSNGYYLNDISLDTPICNELELHYGEGFDKFHDTLLNKRLISKSKGITLFGGKPGTGKTYYINRLIYDLKKHSKKKIILVPSNMVSYILEPEFNSFLLDIVNAFQNYDDIDDTDDTEILDEVSEGVILILEDAEPILMKREISNNSQATSNILNLTDGLLNSIFKIQIIATYNTSDENIDSAILRDKRLVAKKTFNELSLENTKSLIEHLGIDETVTTGLTLAQIYSLQDKEDDNILIENKNKKNITNYL